MISLIFHLQLRKILREQVNIHIACPIFDDELVSLNRNGMSPFAVGNIDRVVRIIPCNGRSN